uniref:Uncharacterized protein n=1 Tax=Strigamia maritima TaxID=126957 RepID=T1IN44_STRMM
MKFTALNIMANPTRKFENKIVQNSHYKCGPDTVPIGHLSSPDTMAEPSQSPAMLKYLCRLDTCPDRTEFFAPTVSGPPRLY